MKKYTEWRNVDTSLINDNIAEASLDNRSKKGRPVQHQHAPLLIANSADVNMNGKRKCAQPLCFRSGYVDDRSQLNLFGTLRLGFGLGLGSGLGL